MTKAAELAKMGEVLTNSQIGGRRNIIINGAMQVAQRGTSSTSSGYSTVDRFRSDINNGTVTHSQETLSSGSPYDDGFRSFFRLTNTTSSSATSHRRRFYQEIEAQNIAKSGWNYTSSSSFITVSFWVRTSVAGDYYFGLRSFDGTSQGYVWEETLSANTWTKVTKSVSGNTNVQIDNDNNAGLAVIFYQSNGTDFTGGSSLDVWHTYDNAQRTPDDTNGWGGTTGATYDVTGIQLEVGEKATPFEHRSFGEELALCQRYYEKSFPYATAPASNLGDARFTIGTEGQVHFKVRKRANATMTSYGALGTGSNWHYFTGSWVSASPGMSGNEVLSSYYLGTTSFVAVSGQWAADAEL